MQLYADAPVGVCRCVEEQTRNLPRMLDPAGSAADIKSAVPLLRSCSSAGAFGTRSVLLR